MRYARPHSHPCKHCLVHVECGGDLEQNHDGWPEVVCRTYHMDTSSFLCESCEQLFAGGACEWCGEQPAAHTFEDSDDASGYRGDVHLCTDCVEKRQ